MANWSKGFYMAADNAVEAPNEPLAMLLSWLGFPSIP